MKKFMIAALAVLLLAAAVWPAGALEFQGESYVLDTDGKTPVYIPKMYESAGIIQQVGGDNPYLSSPSDMFLDGEGRLYISDTGNDRVVRLNAAYQVEKEYTTADGLEFISPNGIFVDEYDELFIADTGNNRIVHLDADGTYIESFFLPESDLLAEVSQFEPNKVAINKNTGFLYVIQGRHFMTIDAQNGFKGYVGAQEVGFSLKDFLVRLFASDTQKKALGKRYPASYANFCIEDDQLVYAVGVGQTDQIKIINSVGNNIYPPGFYGEMSYKEDGTAVFPLFTDITVDKGGIVTVAEQNSAKLYQYDSEGNLLGVFGGQGVSKGYFQVPAGLVTDAQGRLYVLDSAAGSIQILAPTRFASLIHEANARYQEGRYEEALTLWEQVTQIDRNYPLAQRSIGKILYKQKEYAGAMAEYRGADDRAGYGAAFEKRQYELFREHFALVVIVGAIVFFGAIFLAVWLYRKAAVFDDELNGIRRDGKGDGGRG